MRSIHPMRWNKPDLRSNTQDLLARDKPSSTGWVRHQGLEEVRKAMLQSLAGTSGCEAARMNMRLRYAVDIEALWYLRADLFDTLVALRGETGARSQLDRITALFQGQLQRPAQTSVRVAPVDQRVAPLYR
ncbi:MAG: hypothetical protein QM569_13695 [Acidovorax sp.]|uniref:hypothetical protein n=1 Tax=Acidovorax sp. TaxID=1872122 RepID=UPI0039E3822C